MSKKYKILPIGLRYIYDIIKALHLIYHYINKISLTNQIVLLKYKKNCLLFSFHIRIHHKILIIIFIIT